MRKLVTCLAATAAFSLFASAGMACDFHAAHVTASVPKEDVVAMSTAEEAVAPVVITTTSTVCPAGQASCASASK
jgi:hypothetical protein